jgi:D-alanine-D-alanine ligase
VSRPWAGDSRVSGSQRRRTRVAVIGGGRNSEHAVSRQSAAAVAAGLDRDQYEVVRLTITRDGGWCLGFDDADGSGAVAVTGDGDGDGDDRAVGFATAIVALQECDVAFPLVHGAHGEDGSLAALCDFAGIPYVGSGVTAGALAMDKWATKLAAEAAGVRTAPGYLVTRHGRPRRGWTGPVVVKPVNGGSSIGVTLVTSPADLDDAVRHALELDDRALVEECVAGREIDIAVWDQGSAGHEPITSPALGIVAPGLFDFAAKYEGEPDFRVPAGLSEAEDRELRRAAVAVYRAVGCTGVARTDFFLTAESGWILNEVNTAPGMTQHSQVPKMFAAAGIGYPDLLDAMITDALGQPAA